MSFLRAVVSTDAAEHFLVFDATLACEGIVDSTS